MKHPNLTRLLVSRPGRLTPAVRQPHYFVNQPAGITSGIGRTKCGVRSTSSRRTCRDPPGPSPALPRPVPRGESPQPREALPRPSRTISTARFASIGRSGSISSSRVLPLKHAMLMNDHARIMNGTDIRVLQPCGCLCFTDESFEPFGIRNIETRQFQSDFSCELGVFRKIHRTHATLIEKRQNAVAPELGG